MSIFAPLADAVAALLNANEFSMPFVAQRVYDPMRPMETMEQLRVDVVLGDKKCHPMDRARQQNDVRIEIVVRQVISPPAGSVQEQEALDALLALMESIDDYMCLQANRRPPDAPWAGWQESELVYPFLPKHLRESRQYTSLLRITYLVATAAATIS
jgi:hypothetical protein